MPPFFLFFFIEWFILQSITLYYPLTPVTSFFIRTGHAEIIAGLMCKYKEITIAWKVVIR
jgi:hypothetical protein